MRFTVHELDGTREINVRIEMMVVAGWTARDPASIRRRLDELAAVGLPLPAKTPQFYPVGADRLTQAPVIHVLGPDTAGEVEAVLIGTVEGMIVAVGSDHTDFGLEATHFAAAKQLCPKPVSRGAWWWTDVADHWDRIELASDKVAKDGTRTPCQRGGADVMLPPIDLVADHFYGYKAMPPGFVMYLGTVPPMGAANAAERLAVTLHDPVLGRTLTHEYRVYAMPRHE